MVLIYSSISICDRRRDWFKACARKLGVSRSVLLSVLCFKAGHNIANVVRCLKAVEYQEKRGGYKPMPVYFFAPDHEYMHGNRLASKISVSKLIAFAIDEFLDEIMENGINPLEIAMLRKKRHSYTKKSYFLRNISFSSEANSQFEEYIMKMRYEKT